MTDYKEPKKGMFARVAEMAMFSKIENRDDALKTVDDTSKTFFFVAALQSAIGLFIAPMLLVDAALYVILGLILKKWKARTAAVLLLLLSGFAASTTVMNKMGYTSEGGTNILIAAIVLWAAIRAVEASFKLHGKFA